MDLQLDPLEAGAFSEFRDTDRLLRGAGAAGVEHDFHFGTVDSGEDVVFGVSDVNPAECNGDQFASGGPDGVRDWVVGYFPVPRNRRLRNVRPAMTSSFCMIFLLLVVM